MFYIVQLSHKFINWRLSVLIAAKQILGQITFISPVNNTVQVRRH